MRCLGMLALMAVAAWSSPVAYAQSQGQYKPVEATSLPLDRSGVWTMNFAYTPPRIITVTLPDGSQRQAWYMVYRVWNKTDTPLQIIPEFELTTKDGKLQTFLDEPLPLVADKVREIEDPTGEYQLKTTVGISKRKIPVTKPDSIPRYVHGVAIWMDAPVEAKGTNNFSIYVSGLSNGLTVAENDSGQKQIKRKTLKIDFLLPTDNARPKMDAFVPNNNRGLGAEKWIYRSMPVPIPENIQSDTPKK